MQQRLAAWVTRPWFWLAVLALPFSWPIIQAVRAELPDPPPVLGHLPDFALTEQRGLPFGSADLRGRIWVADFIFTRCPTVCPLLTHKMARLQDRMREAMPAIHLVSFSVDPEFDTPEVLAAYAARFRASPRMWSFLTGAPDEIKRTVRDGLKIALERQGSPSDDVPDILHGTHFVLIDGEMQIRGYYATDDPARIDQLVHDVAWLVNHNGS